MRLAILLFFSLFSLQGLSHPYRANFDAINRAFSDSEDVSLNRANVIATTHSSAFTDESKSYGVAAFIALATVVAPGIIWSGYFACGFATFFGFLLFPAAFVSAALASNPWHRVYLGMGDAGFKVSALYCLTFNGLGTLPLVDAVFLFTSDEYGEYIDNPKFLMWMDDMNFD